MKLSRYAFEDVHRAVLKREIPIYSPADLSAWHTAGGELRWKVIRYVLHRTSLNLEMLSRMQLVTRTRCVVDGEMDGWVAREARTHPSTLAVS